MSKTNHPGKEITIFFDGSKCIHSRNCVLKEPKVFKANTPGDWIQPDNAPAHALIALAHNCPSGAITYELVAEKTNGAKEEVPPHVNTIHVRENGPYAVTADIRIDGVEPTTRATLCRCGLSDNKPYCDGSHSVGKFTATGEQVAKESASLETRNGPLEITPTPDGPLKLDGNVEICAGTGHTIDRTTQSFLCRCGHSGNKPFCDGSHKKFGFKS